MIKNITTKVLLYIGGLTICCLALILYSFYSFANRRANELIEQQASIALRFDLAIRGYIGDSIRPIMYKLINQEDFIVEAMSTTYVARSIFEEVRKDFPEYIIKFSSDNPRNPINQAGIEELKIIEHFNDHPNLNKWEGIITINHKKYMAKFNARRMKTSCLHCHGDPEDAPVSMLEKYGSVAGFHREVGKVIGMDTVAIPMKQVTDRLWHELKITIPVFVVGLLLFFLAIVGVLKFLVIDRLVLISKHFASAVEEEDYTRISHIDINPHGKDEIYNLTLGYNALTDRLKKFYDSLNHKVKQRTHSLDLANQKLLQKINEKNEVVKALEETQERFKALHSASCGGLAIHDKGIILDCNQGLSKMTGYSAAELIGMNGLLLISEDSRELVMNNILAGSEKAYEAVGLRKNGEAFPIRVEGRNVPYKGAMVRSVEFRDMTEIKRAEEEREKLQAQLAQAQKIESIGGLAAGVAHEINNPLAGVIQNAALIKSRMENIDMPANLTVAKELNISTEDIRSFMEKRDILHLVDSIHQSGKRAAEIVSSMLNFSRQPDSQTSSHSPVQLVDEILELAATDYDLKKQYDFRSIEIVKEYAANLPMLVCEGAKIQQVLLNIFRNGAQAMQMAGTESPRFILRISRETELEMIRIEIEDNGPGMDKETRSKIFDPFFTTKPVGIGTGLGLSVSYFIITEHHNGTMDVVSEPGQGANFIIRLPV